MTVIALIGSKALLLLFAWLASAIAASYLSGRKGYGERPGLASGLLLNVLGVVVWLVIPPKADSLWRKIGAFGRGGGKPSAPAHAEDAGAEPGSTAAG